MNEQVNFGLVQFPSFSLMLYDSTWSLLFQSTQFIEGDKTKTYINSELYDEVLASSFQICVQRAWKSPFHLRKNKKLDRLKTQQLFLDPSECGRGWGGGEDQDKLLPPRLE